MPKRKLLKKIIERIIRNPPQRPLALVTRWTKIIRPKYLSPDIITKALHTYTLIQNFFFIRRGTIRMFVREI